MSRIMDALSAFAIAHGAKPDSESITDFFKNEVSKLPEKDLSELAAILMTQGSISNPKTEKEPAP